MKRVLFFLILFTCLVELAKADDGLHAVLNVTSIHFGSTEQNNAKNYGVGIEYSRGDWRGMLGEYRNSNDKRSTYAMAGWTPIGTQHVRFGLMAGAINGYAGINNGKIGPAAAGLVRIEYGKWGMNISVLPKMATEKNGSAPWTLGFQAKRSFN